MSFPKDLGAYTDCEEHFERALLTERGIAISFSTAKEVHRYRMKMNTYRDKLRKRSRELYEVDDPRYSASPYDKFVLRIDPNDATKLRIEVLRSDPIAVEEL